MEIVIEEDLKEFIKRLPDLDKDKMTVHLIMLAVRSRKAKEILGVKIKDLVVERKVIRPIDDWRERYFNQVYNLSILQHEGKYNIRDLDVPGETMGIFATLSPRNVLSSVADMMKEDIGYFYKLDEGSKMELAKQSSRFFGFLHKHKDRITNFVTLDLDSGDKDVLNNILDDVNKSGIPLFMVTETSRGYHAVLDLTKPEHAKIFYGQEALIQKLGLKYSDKGLEIQKDSQEPIPGTLYCKPRKEIHYVKILQ